MNTEVSLNPIWESFFEELRLEVEKFDISLGNFAAILTAYLQKTVQTRFAVGGGYLFAVDGTVVDNPSDIVLYDRAYTPTLHADKTPLIPVETTGVVVQAIDVLTEHLLQEELAHLQAVRRLPKLTRQSFTSGVEMVTNHPYTMGVIVAWESELTLEQIHEQLIGLQSDLPTTERVSAVFVIGQGVLLYETAATGELRFFPLANSRLTVRPVGRDTLAYLLLYLTSYLNSIQIVPPNLMALLHQIR